MDHKAVTVRHSRRCAVCGLVVVRDVKGVKVHKYEADPTPAQLVAGVDVLIDQIRPLTAEAEARAKADGTSFAEAFRRVLADRRLARGEVK